MADEQQQLEAPSSPPETSPLPAPTSSPPPFDPTRSIIKRKALIKELAAMYHQECLTHCQELLELQQKRDEPFIDLKASEDSRKETTKSSKRAKKTR